MPLQPSREAPIALVPHAIIYPRHTFQLTIKRERMRRVPLVNRLRFENFELVEPSRLSKDSQQTMLIFSTPCTKYKLHPSYPTGPPKQGSWMTSMLVKHSHGAWTSFSSHLNFRHLASTVLSLNTLHAHFSSGSCCLELAKASSCIACLSLARDISQRDHVIE